MRRVVCFAIAALVGATASSQGLLDCLEPDVLRGLLLQGESQPIITGAMPVELAPLKVPREFTWIGSAERITGRMDASTTTRQVTAAWRSPLSPAAARMVTATALAASGWDVRTQPVTPVFISEFMQIPQPACRDGQPLGITASSMDGVTYVLATIQRGNNGNSICNQPVPASMMRNTGLENYLPRLAMPADPATGEEVRTGSNGSSSGNGGFNARAEFTTQDSTGNIARHFAKQMAEQGWTSDANWSGVISAGSSWSRQEAGVRIQSTLSVVALDGQRFATTIRVLKLQ